MNQVKYLIVHNLGGTLADPLYDTSNQTFEQVNEYHRQEWNFKSSLGYYLGYHYWIGKGGELKQARAENEEGAHCIGKNNSSIGIVWAGNGDLKEPTEAQIYSLRLLLKSLKDEYNIPLSNIVPHRAFSTKTCYGRKLAEDYARKLVTENLVKTMEPSGYTITKYETPYLTQVFLYWLNIYQTLYKKPLVGGTGRECSGLIINH